MVLFRILGFIFSWLVPFGIVYINHVAFNEGGWDTDMFGLLLVMALAIGLIRYIDGRVKTWDIQNRNKIFIHNWTNLKKIVIIVFLTWVLYTIEDDLSKMQLSGLMVTCSFILGWFLTLLGLYKKKATT